MEEIASIAPIDDRKLVFRPIRLESDVLYPDRTQDAQPLSQLGTDAAALHFSISERKLDLLAEYLNRVRLAYRTSPSTSSSGDPDTSRDSSGFTSHGRSSDGSAGGTSHSASTDSGDDDSADIGRRGHDEDDFSDVDDFGESVDESAERPPLAAPSTRTLNTNAPPLNIPIEELLRSEGFTPAGLAGQRAPSSQASSGTEQTSSASPSGTASSNRQRRQRRLLRDTPFTLRRTDLRGATQHNIDLCTELYEALAAEAGVDAEPQAGMAAW
uniref:Uncharacterized protein n=2 Tax=Kalmanozyma brasiliensis (strain GHG001) TaxID=1365824 RepID=V5GFT5_KALBG